MLACSYALRGERPISYCPIEVIVAGLHLRWNGVWQRPNHLLSRAARDIPVVVLEEPLAAQRDGTGVRSEGNVTVITPYRSMAPRDALDRESVASVREAVGARRPLVWLYTPMMAGL